MRKHLTTIILLLTFVSVEAQSYKHPNNDRYTCGIYDYDNIGRMQDIDSIFSTTGIRLTEHPLVRTDNLKLNNLGHADTTFNNYDSSKQIIYYDLSNRKFLTEIYGLTKDYPYLVSIVFDSLGRQTFFDAIDCNRADFRERIIFDKDGNEVIRCIFSGSSGLRRIDITTKDIERSIADHCRCDF